MYKKDKTNMIYMYVYIYICLIGSIDFAPILCQPYISDENLRLNKASCAWASSCIFSVS